MEPISPIQKTQTMTVMERLWMSYLFRIIVFSVFGSGYLSNETTILCERQFRYPL